MLHWNSIVEGATAGVAAAVLIAIFAISRDTFRNMMLRVRIARAFRSMGCGTCLDGITAGIHNRTGRVFTVREVVMLTDKGNYRFNPTGDVTSTFKEQDQKLTRKQIRMLKQGKVKSIEGPPLFEMRRWSVQPTGEGFTIMQPYTKHDFLLSGTLIANFHGTVSGFRIVVEYESWTHRVKIIQVRENRSREQFQKTVEHFRKEIHDGTLNAARMKFGKPPIGFQPAKQPAGANAERKKNA